MKRTDGNPHDVLDKQKHRTAEHARNARKMIERHVGLRVGREPWHQGSTTHQIPENLASSHLGTDRIAKRLERGSFAWPMRGDGSGHKDGSTAIHG